MQKLIQRLLSCQQAWNFIFCHQNSDDLTNFSCLNIFTIFFVMHLTVKLSTSIIFHGLGLPNLLYITMWMRWLWLGCSGECGPLPSKLGCNTTLRPSAVGWYCIPISKEEDRIHQCIRARVNAFTLFYREDLVYVFWPDVLNQIFSI